MATPEDRPAAVENENHTYAGSRIPWFVHVLWLLFWIFAIGYTLAYLVPALRKELLTPP
jgi:hypothetical protein